MTARIPLALLLLVSVVMAGSPFVDYVVPRGARAGAELDVVFHGDWLGDAADVFFLGAGITVVEIEPLDRKKARVRLKIAEDCKLGEHLLFLRTRTGLSNLAAFWVGVLPEVDEVEGLRGAQAIALDTTVNGMIHREDVDVFVIEVTERERISFEVQGARIGSGDFDPRLVIRDENWELVRDIDDTVLGRADPMGSAILEPGRYFFTLTDVTGRGGPGSHYRFHVGRFPRPHVAYPPGFRRGKESTFTFISDTERFDRTCTIEKPDRIHSFIVEDDRGVAPTPIKLLSHPMPFFTEENVPEKIDKLPFAFAGVISAPGEMDELTFECGEGVALRAAAYAWTVGSSLDPVLDLFDEKGRMVTQADDGMGIDTRLSRTTRRGGKYTLRIRDLHRRGGERFVYRIEVSETQPGRSQRLLPPVGYLSPCAVVPRGGRLVVALRGNGVDKEQGARPRFRDLPPGVTAHVLPYRDDSDTIPVVFEAAPDAELGHSLARVDLFEDVRGKPRGAGFYHSHPLSRVDRTLVYEARGVGRMPCAVIEEPPVDLEIEAPSTPLVAGSTVRLRVKVRRRPGFEKSPVRLVGAWSPPGVSIGKLDVAAGKDEVTLPVSAGDGARSTTWPLALSALVETGGRTVSSSELFDLRVVERLVVAKAGICRVPRGGKSGLRVALDVRREWEGEATLEILGSSKWFRSEPVAITSSMTEATIPLEVTRKAPLGARSIYVAVTVPSPDGPLRHRFRTGELRVEAASPSASRGAAE